MCRCRVNNGYKLYFAYRKDGRIYYRANKFTICTGYSGIMICRGSFIALEEISGGDRVTYRYTPDISLRNGLPVIVYQGKMRVCIAVQYEDGGEGINIDYDEYPVVEKFKKIDPELGEIWSIFYRHHAPMFSTQQNPTTEGSKNAYAHLLNYSIDNTLFKKFVRIDNLFGYSCSPSTFTGKDAKFVRGSYQGQLGSYLGTYSHPSLLTLSPQAPLYYVDIQEFSITNTNPQTDEFNNLAGVIEMNDLYYKFTLGPLFANNQITFDDDSPPQNVQTIIEFNDEMVSDVFMMSDYDTLILGANGCYEGDIIEPFEIIRYDVNLINNTTGEPHRLLFHDTVNVEDSLEIRFLRGFIIEDIPNGSDSFYVELVVNPDDIGGDEDYGMGGDYDGGDGGGDALNWKVKVFFEGDNSSGNNATPKEYSLSQNYPNPFNPITTINYELPKDGIVKLIIYDILGREVSKLVNNELKSAGKYSVVFDGSSLSSGIYFYRIEVKNGKDFMKVKRMVLIK